MSFYDRISIICQLWSINYSCGHNCRWEFEYCCNVYDGRFRIGQEQLPPEKMAVICAVCVIEIRDKAERGNKDQERVEQHEGTKD